MTADPALEWSPALGAARTQASGYTELRALHRRLRALGDVPADALAVVFELVSFAFDDHVVLRAMSFSVPKGSMRILLGASGAERGNCRISATFSMWSQS